MGSPQIQADGPLDQGREGLVRSAAPRESKTLCPLATMPRQRPNIGSRMNREVHVRFWERPRVKVPRATRQTRRFKSLPATSALPPSTDIIRPVRLVRSVQEAKDRGNCKCNKAKGMLRNNLVTFFGASCSELWCSSIPHESHEETCRSEERRVGKE